MRTTSQKRMPPSSSPGLELPAIDLRILVEKVPALKLVVRRQASCDDVGFDLVVQSLKGTSFQRGVFSTKPSRAAESIWSQSKSAFYRLLATDDEEFAETRGRLALHQPRSTYTLMSSLSFWLSGAVGIPISAAMPIACVLLHLIATSSVEALLDADLPSAAES